MNNVFKDFRFIKRKLRFIINKLFYKDYASNKNKLGKLNSILDDVGQKMEYLKGSHKLYNTSFNKIFKNDDQLLDNYEKISLIGKKGTCYFFDGNGLHRGNRNQSYTRDILAITYRYLD